MALSTSGNKNGEQLPGEDRKEELQKDLPEEDREGEKDLAEEDSDTIKK